MLTVTNKGPDAAANVVVTDPVDESLVTVTSPPPGCTQAAGTVTCPVASLAAAIPGSSRLPGRSTQASKGW